LVQRLVKYFLHNIFLNKKTKKQKISKLLKNNYRIPNINVKLLNH